MLIPYFQVNAFSSNTFGGNPAGVCLLDEWPDDALLQKIAAENNLSETAFIKKSGTIYQLRWFTPKTEVDLCGHATLACAHVLFNHLNTQVKEIVFQTNTEQLKVKTEDDLLYMDFPSRPGVRTDPPATLAQALGKTPLEVYLSRDYLAVFKQEEAVRAIQPRMEKLQQLSCTGIIVSAPGQDCDFVSRFFAPAVGIPEDPVTGSAHCTLVPYWSEKLGKKKMFARQLSARAGEIHCLDSGDRVMLAGQAVTYLRGELFV